MCWRGGAVTDARCWKGRDKGVSSEWARGRKERMYEDHAREEKGRSRELDRPFRFDGHVVSGAFLLGELRMASHGR